MSTPVIFLQEFPTWIFYASCVHCREEGGGGVGEGGKNAISDICSLFYSLAGPINFT